MFHCAKSKGTFDNEIDYQIITNVFAAEEPPNKRI